MGLSQHIWYGAAGIFLGVILLVLAKAEKMRQRRMTLLVTAIASLIAGVFMTGAALYEWNLR